MKKEIDSFSILFDKKINYYSLVEVKVEEIKEDGRQTYFAPIANKKLGLFVKSLDNSSIYNFDKLIDQMAKDIKDSLDKVEYYCRKLPKHVVNLSKSFVNAINQRKYPKLTKKLINKINNVIDNNNNNFIDGVFINYNENKSEFIKLSHELNNILLTKDKKKKLINNSNLFLKEDEFILLLIEKERRDIGLFTKDYIMQKLIFNLDKYMKIRHDYLEINYYDIILYNLNYISYIN